MASLLRHSARAFARRSIRLRAEETGAALDAPRVVRDFVADWNATNTILDAPKSGADFLDNRTINRSEAIPEKLTLNFYLPHKVLHSAKAVDMVVIPTKNGYTGFEPGKVPTVAQLQPGVITIHDENNVESLFVSSGFAFVHADSTADICAVEAVPLDQLDPEAVKKGLAEYAKKLDSAAPDSVESAIAAIGVQVHTAMNDALSA